MDRRLDACESRASAAALRAARRSLAIGLVACAIAALGAQGQEQASLPFEISNPKHLKWPMEEARRIYLTACEVVARSLRPEKPPRLQPKFVLVLGAKANQIVRTDGNAQVQLKAWDPEGFAEAMVILTAREMLRSQDVPRLARDTLNVAEATVSVSELKEKR